jgi:hypothetical protein
MLLDPQISEWANPRGTIPRTSGRTHMPEGGNPEN